ncbi:GNAT family N-acetyltransferase [Sphingomonas quercus]|uniref:GNAT family N-acetyltransferase n=1 Tax=Sphingomonas quercus TaxID=2842451 RepID=A0ABS6BDU5_9SPHN|nr:GNAT family N-acetyltransferase [Sphingomonas quercus]MBU3076488.1 GNAT family N-acetyltransferase [Sphingomonas quercus]
MRSITLREMDIRGEKKSISIRLVESRERIRAARDLINHRYAWRGYGSDHDIRADAHHMTFTAEDGGAVIGTITLAVDSPRGLAVDLAFRDEVDPFRAVPGSGLCELTKFAFDPAVQSRELMAALFHIVFVYGHRTHGCTDLLIEVNPRHVRFYEAMLGFTRVGALKLNEKVAAPAQLMALKVAAIREQINRFAGGRGSPGSRSLYPFFFSPKDEDGIFNRLAHAATEAVMPLYATSPRHSREIAVLASNAAIRPQATPAP